LFFAGWVHRDISSGNLLGIKRDGRTRGILGDLEYAKRFDPDGMTGSDLKTVCLLLVVYSQDADG
jgi:hypothetical protein